METRRENQRRDAVRYRPPAGAYGLPLGNLAVRGPTRGEDPKNAPALKPIKREQAVKRRRAARRSGDNGAGDGGELMSICLIPCSKN